MVLLNDVGFVGFSFINTRNNPVFLYNYHWSQFRPPGSQWPSAAIKVTFHTCWDVETHSIIRILLACHYGLPGPVGNFTVRLNILTYGFCLNIYTPRSLHKCRLHFFSLFLSDSLTRTDGALALSHPLIIPL